jgi:hypothetical protein
MAFRPNRAQLDALATQLRSTFPSDEMGASAAAQVPGIIRCVSNLLTSETDLKQLGDQLHAILITLPSYTEETLDGNVVHYDLAHLAMRALRARNLSEFLKQFASCPVYGVDQTLLSFYSGPSQPFGIRGEFYRAVLPVNGIKHAKQVLAELGVTSAAEEIGKAFIENIAGVSVWGTIEKQDNDKWHMVLEVHDPGAPYQATYTAFTRACIVNQALVAYARNHKS